jgi:tetratricopeptide (TPR) repeat protein
MGILDFFSQKEMNTKIVEDLIETVRLDPKRRYDALVSLKKIGNPKAIDTFNKRLHDPSPRIRKISILALGEIGDLSAINHLQLVVDTQDFSNGGKRTNFGHTENITLAKEAIRKIQQRNSTNILPPSKQPDDLNWTDEEIQLLRQFWDAGKSVQIIADQLKRSPEVIVHTLIDTGLIGYNDDKCYPRPTRFGFTWNDQEKSQLITEFEAGKSISEIAYIHQRNLNSIFHSLVKLRMINYNDRDILEKYTEDRSIPNNNQLVCTLISELERNGNIGVRNAAANQLSFFPESSVVNALINCVKNDPKVRFSALGSLRKIGDPIAIPVFIEHSKDPSVRIRLVSVNALGEIGNTTVLEQLEYHLKCNDYQNRFKYGGNQEIIQAVKDAIQKIRSRDRNTSDTLIEVAPSDKCAEETPQEVSSQTNNAPFLNKEGFRLAKMNKFEDAIIFFKEALLIDKNYIDALNNHGWASSQLGRYEEAISYYENAKKIDPNNVRAWRAIGWNLARIHRYDEALTHIDVAISLDSQSGRSWNFKGEILFFKGDFENAMICFEKALILDPKNKDAMENMTRVAKILVPSTRINVVREYEFYAGYIRLKISVNNQTTLAIHDVRLDPDVDRAILYLERHEPEEYPSENGKIFLGTIYPNNNRTISLYLEPIICAKEGTEVHCHIQYKNAQGKPGSLDMEPIRIQVVCPIFETKKAVNIGQLKELIETLPSRDTKIFSVPRNLDSPTQLKLFQSIIQLHDIQHISTLRCKNNFESWYYGMMKVSQKEVVIKLGVAKDMDMVEITAYSYNPKDLTGLLAEISRDATEEVSKRGNVQKIFNVSIKDSVVQRTNLMSFCDDKGE